MGGPTVESLAEAPLAVEALLTRHALSLDPAVRLLDLTSELGELTKEFLEATAYGTSAFVRTTAWDAEIGDVAFALLALAAATGTPLPDALAGTIAKIEERVATIGSAASGRTRGVA